MRSVEGLLIDLRDKIEDSLDSTEFVLILRDKETKKSTGFIASKTLTRAAIVQALEHQVEEILNLTQCDGD